MAAEEDKGTEKDRKPEEVPAAPAAPVVAPAAAPGWVVPPNLRRAPLVPGVAPAPRPAVAPAPRPPAAPPPAPPPAAVPVADTPPAPRIEAPTADHALSEPHLDRIEPPALDEGVRAAASIEPQLGSVPIPPKPKRWSKLPPPLMARTTDRVIDEGEKPRRYGAWIVLGVLILLGAGGFWLWRQGRLDPILTPAHNLIAKIESYFPGAEPETTTPTASTTSGTAAQGTASSGATSTAAPPDATMVQEIKQLLAKLDLSPGPIDGNLDQATQDAIRSYQKMAGEPVNGQPSQALLNDLRVVAAYQQPPG
ncbi:MAG TPA: peptidoglycan-binding domain-containing protein [Dongiaceae bacterium]